MINMPSIKKTLFASEGVAPQDSTRSSKLTNLLIAAGVCICIICYFLTTSSDFLHWFLLPILLCGITIGQDAVEWARSRINTFDPFGVFGLLGFHFFFMAPLLHVYWQYWPLYGLTQLEDYRPWLGGMAWLNFIGLLICRYVRVLVMNKDLPRKRVWKLSVSKMNLVLPLALLITGGLQMALYYQFGGVSGLMEAYSRKRGAAFEGLGWYVTLSESFPILAIMGYALLARKRPVLRTWTALAIVAVVFFLLQLLFGGLRGSRSTTIFALFWVLGIVHFTIRRVPKQVVFAGVLFLLVYMYVYRFYKHSGVEGLEALQTEKGQRMMQNRSGGGLMFTLLVDMSRADMQAYMLYQLNNPRSKYQYAWGRTYVGAIASLVPRAIWSSRPPTKAKEGTEFQANKKVYYGPNSVLSSRVYGLSGEIMLNFGYLAIPLGFIPIGLFLGAVRRLVMRMDPDDLRWLICPYIIYFSFTMIVADSDNLLFGLFKSGLMPFLVVLLGSHKVWRSKEAVQPARVVSSNAIPAFPRRAT